jgi:homoserine acetyltransferase
MLNRTNPSAVFIHSQDIWTRKSAIMSQEYETFQLGDWKLQSGENINNAYIAYKTFGDPNTPAIVYPTWFSGGN